MPRLTPDGEQRRNARAATFRALWAALSKRQIDRLFLAMHCSVSAGTVERWISGARIPSKRHLTAISTLAAKPKR